MPKGDKLPIKQELFIKHYLESLNATQSYIKAWYNWKGAESSASKLLTNPKVKAIIDDELDKRKKELDIDWLRVLRNMKELVDICLQKKFIKKINKDTWEIEEVIWQLDSAWANTALSNLAKYLLKSQESLDITSKGEKIGLTEKQIAAIKSLSRKW